MLGLFDNFNIYLIPPVIFLLTGVSLGIFSLLKGKRQYENVLFAIICFWYSMLMPVFISHHIFKGNIELIMNIERLIHVFYVFGPPILILFTHSLVNIKNRIIEIGGFIFSFIISLFVFTDYYFSGLWEFNWGYMGKGGIFLQIFGLWGMIAIAYSLLLSIKHLKTDIDDHVRIKIKYIMFAILTIGILTIGNMPALNGIDIYPPGNFAFIPIIFMAWGIFRHDAIKINLYTKRRITGTITRIFVFSSFLASVPVIWWAISRYSLDHIISKIIPYGIPPLLSFVVAVFLVFLSLRLGENRKDSIIFSILMLAYAFLGIDIFLNTIITSPPIGLSISRLSHLFVVFLPPLGMHLIRIVSNRRSEKWLLIISYIVSIVLFLFSQSDLYLQNMYVYSWGLFAKKAILFDIMGLSSAVTLVYNIIILIQAYRKSNNSFYSHRFLFLIIGFSSATILTLGNIPAMNGYNFYPPGNFIFISTTFFAIALFRYNRNELIRLIGSFVYYGINSAAVLGLVYILNLKHSDELLPMYSIISLSGVLIFNYFLRKIRYMITSRDDKKLKLAFETLSHELSMARNIKKISELISLTLFIDLFSGDCTILLFDDKKNLFEGDHLYNIYSNYNARSSHDKSSRIITIESDHPLLNYIDAKYSVIKADEIEFLILNKGLMVPVDDPLRESEMFLPVFFENHLSAIILLGLKIDGSLYSDSEKEFLYQLGIMLGPHIENAKILQNLEKTLEERTQKLSISEKKYRDFIENTTEIIYKTDWKGNFIYSNPAFQRVFEYKEEEIKSLNYLDLILPENRDKDFVYFKKYLKNEIDSRDYELSVITKSGKILWVVQNVNVIRDDNGHIKEFDCIVRDITDKKTAEDALRESERNYQQLMNNVNDCVFICEKNGYFKYVNNAVTRLVGYSQEEFVGKHFTSIVHPDHRDKIFQFYLHQFKEEIETTYCEFPVMLKDDEEKWAGQTIRMMKNNEGDIEFYGVTRDISEQKKAEEDRQDLERAKSRFFSNISHEIRTPLTLMLGPIESVLQGDYGKEIDNKFFKNLHRNTLSLLKLVNNFLDFSKIEAGKMILRVQECDIVYFSRQYLSNIEQAGQSKNINIKFHSSAKSINLFFDPEKMDKIFMNLLSNALKFTGDGGEISISIKESENSCSVTVADTGEGISEKYIYTIFDRFSQADSSSTRKYEGTGIGLALVKELIELHGGLIEVESRFIEDYKENHGSKFTILIPKGIEHFEKKSHVTFSENNDLDNYIKDYRLIGMNELEGSHSKDSSNDDYEKNEDIKNLDSKETILIVDDNEDMRSFLKVLLKKHYNVILAEDGLKGIAAAKNYKPDLILSDVMMPVMNGFDMTAIIKKDDDIKTTPVILLTADTDLMNKVAGLEHGADDYLHKPFNSLELLTRISSLLKNYENQKIINQRNKDIESELEVARLIQERLLPHSMPDIEGYKSHAVYIPMDKVGGDFYDIEERDGFINIMISDVSGHGLPGAFLATVTKIALDNIADRKNPGKVLSLLNDVILKHTVQSNFVTAFFASIDMKTKEMRYSSAGHFPPFIYRKDSNEFLELRAKGAPLGWLKDMTIEEKTIQLKSEDRILFYTDGIIETENSTNELFGEERFQQTVEKNGDVSVEEFSDKLLIELDRYKEMNSFNDDITMLVLDVL